MHSDGDKVKHYHKIVIAPCRDRMCGADDCSNCHPENRGHHEDDSGDPREEDPRDSDEYGEWLTEVRMKQLLDDAGEG